MHASGIDCSYTEISEIRASPIASDGALKKRVPEAETGSGASDSSGG